MLISCSLPDDIYRVGPEGLGLGTRWSNETDIKKRRVGVLVVTRRNSKWRGRRWLVPSPHVAVSICNEWKKTSGMLSGYWTLLGSLTWIADIDSTGGVTRWRMDEQGCHETIGENVRIRQIRKNLITKIKSHMSTECTRSYRVGRTARTSSARTTFPKPISHPSEAADFDPNWHPVRMPESLHFSQGSSLDLMWQPCAYKYDGNYVRTETGNFWSGPPQSREFVTRTTQHSVKLKKPGCVYRRGLTSLIVIFQKPGCSQKGQRHKSFGAT